MTQHAADATGGLVEVDGTTWYRIDELERMEPFLLTVVSDSDLWMFVSSLGPLTAGRVDADGAFLPYETDDRLHRAIGVTGPVTLLTREVGGRREIWQPFARRPASGCTRSLTKHVLGAALTIDEVNPDWGLRVRSTWEPSRAYGWVRTVELLDESGAGADVEVVDGFLDVMPAGVDAATEQLTSNLVDAYKRSETAPTGNAAVYALESLITDRAEPAEALAATLIWSVGLDDVEVHLDERIADDTWQRRPARPPVELLTGRRGAYLLRAPVAVPAGGSRSWMLVADTGLGHAQLLDRLQVAVDPHAPKLVADDVAAGVARLESLLADADGLQQTADAVADAHHLSNVLFNAMRGGVFAHGYEVPVGDLLGFLRHRNVTVHDRVEAHLRAAGDHLDLTALTALADDSGDADLVRLVLEYLPLTFSRRHGDPSRPWNRFAIRVTADDGSDLLYYEGNWRDIFQNWQALLRSYPRYLPHVVAKFLNASTVDGHNPYRITRDGIDWEVPDPDDPWSNIGYWGDHQIVYLLHLLEDWDAAAPAALATWLDRPVFTYADVPYRIAGHEAMVRDPRATIAFDEERAARVAERVARIGSDGRLVVAADDALVRVTMVEKLLVPVLAKLSSYVAGGGIWMNTQRPEWNDANNALAGYGLSMVTLYQLERHLAFLRRILVAKRQRPFALSRQVAGWLDAITQALAAHDPEAAATNATARRQLLDALGRAGQAHRDTVGAGFDPGIVEVEVAAVERLLTAAVTHLQASIRAGRRPDGLYHAYNLVSFPTVDSAVVEHLPVMLEGQVAVLGTGQLAADEVTHLVDALFDSPLFRPDLGTFLLYPAADRPSFLDRNRLAPEVIVEHPVLQELVGRGSGGILEQDAAGGWHFRSDLTNAEALSHALAGTSLDDADQATVQDVYEQLFHHHAFTGRSGGMHGYEGIGSVYWHMVSKLLLAIQVRYLEAVADAASADVVERLAVRYRRVRDGLGFRKSPAAFGAVPTDCYSHTPAHAGAQQPGMTGQAKEQVLARAGELGLVVADGVLALVRPLLPAEELWGDPGDGEVPAYRCTVCATPVRVSRGETDRVRVVRHDGTVTERDGASLTPAEAAEVFDRRGTIEVVEFVTTAR
jgi:hypothetical protein